ncbi:putative olfactory receptor 14L1 [Ornithorhynchus anatinus]|uniref:putative olfactory receptor 14L1 n=1 Tax=Ornithorhynchus anatinus TaxID=9258 RepID=UPI0019D4A8C3|nr:putative olfactory receptor 14L1 [Ornithorhynchus anatinus]
MTICSEILTSEFGQSGISEYWGYCFSPFISRWSSTFNCGFEHISLMTSKKDMANQKAVMELPRLGFSEVRKPHLVQVALFLLVYLGALMGNLIILALTAFNRCLYTPIPTASVSSSTLLSQFTPAIQSVTNTCRSHLQNTAKMHTFLYIQTTIVLVLALKNSRLHYSITFPEQLPSTTFSLTTQNIYLEMANSTKVMEFALLGYSEVWEWELVHAAIGSYRKMAANLWLGGGLSNLMNMTNTYSVPLGGSNVIHQFSSESPHIIKLFQSSRKLQEYGVTSFSSLLASTCFVSIVISYMGFFRVMLRIPTAEGQDKAFSTCLPHLSIITIFVSNSDEAYRKPVSNSHSVLDMLISPFCYGATPRPPAPNPNPLVYNLRNRDLKMALGTVLVKKSINRR